MLLVFFPFRNKLLLLLEMHLPLIMLISSSSSSSSSSFFRFLTLKSGLNHLKQEENRRAADPLVFVKENVATFLDAVDTLKSIFTFFL